MMIPAALPPSRETAPAWFQQRSALAFCAPMLVNGVALPYAPVWLQSLHLGDFEIGVILAVPMIVRIVAAPLVSMLADRLKERADVLVWSGVLSLLTAIALFWTSEFWPIVLVFGLQGATYAPYVPVLESILITGVRRWGFEYGVMRSWGSLAFILSTLGGGLIIGRWGGGALLPIMAGGFVLTVLMGLQAPRVGGDTATARDSRTGKSMLRRPDIQLVMIGSALIQASHAMLYAFSAIYWQDRGFSGMSVGILWSAGVLAEVVAFFLSRPLSRMFSSWTMIRFGCAVAVCRWLLFPIPMGYWGYLALQLLHAFTFAFCHIGIQRRIVDTVAPEQEASAQGAYFFYNGLFMALATLLSGSVFARMGVEGFYAMTLVALAGLACVIVAWYLQPQRTGSGGNTRES